MVTHTRRICLWSPLLSHYLTGLLRSSEGNHYHERRRKKAGGKHLRPVSWADSIRNSERASSHRVWPPATTTRFATYRPEALRLESFPHLKEPLCSAWMLINRSNSAMACAGAISSMLARFLFSD